MELENKLLKQHIEDKEIKPGYIFIPNETQGTKIIEVWENENNLFNIYPYKNTPILWSIDCKILKENNFIKN